MSAAFPNGCQSGSCVVSCGARACQPSDDPPEVDWQARNDAARARWITEHGSQTPCPNCGAPILGHEQNDCVLNTFINIIRDGREDIWDFDEYQLLERHRRCDVDVFWEHIGSVYGGLAVGDFDAPE